jgi:hypothetical protein
MSGLNEEPRRTPCVVREGSFVEPCTALEECIVGSGSFNKKKGVVLWDLYDMKTMKHTRRFIGIRSGVHADKGIVFNFCPFCATPIDTPVKPDSDGD